MAPGAAADDRWAATVAQAVHRLLRDRAGDVDHGDPEEVASRMVATVPRRSAWGALGPFYSTTGIAKVLGGVSRQAVEDRRRRGSVIALQTAEGAWVYPAFQLDDRNRVLRPVVDAHRRLCRGRIDPWSAAAALVGAQPELDGRSIREHLAGGGAQTAVTELLDATVHSLA